MREIRRLNRKFRKFHKMTGNDKHRLTMEMAKAVDNYTAELLAKNERE